MCVAAADCVCMFVWDFLRVHLFWSMGLFGLN